MKLEWPKDVSTCEKYAFQRGKIICNLCQKMFTDHLHNETSHMIWNIWLLLFKQKNTALEWLNWEMLLKWYLIKNQIEISTTL